ncbi:MAG: phosphoribosylanthranilate isomerase [Desulfobacteraceae bacterium]|jgi:phosphoribosylanthranilate isomerase
MTRQPYPQIKICGLTDPAQARACADLGADAIGLVFFSKSPRNVTMDQAAAITALLPDHVAAVGVFVDPELDTVRRTVEKCALTGVQLHGNEPPEFIAALRSTTTARIVKALFTGKPPKMADAGQYEVDGYLVECGKGPLPGGNAMTWNWAIAEAFAHRHPLILAGGLAPDNVARAIAACRPDAVDASSGLELVAGQKDLTKVKQFIDQVRKTTPLYLSQKRSPRSILTPSENIGQDDAGNQDHKTGHST